MRRGGIDLMMDFARALRPLDAGHFMTPFTAQASPLDGLFRNAAVAPFAAGLPDLGRPFGAHASLINAITSPPSIGGSFSGLAGVNWLSGLVGSTSAFDLLVAPLLRIPSWIDSGVEFRARLDRFVVVMNELGWPPPMRMPSRLITEVLDLVEEVGVESARDQVETLILDSYDEATLERMVEEWRMRGGLPPHALAMMTEAVAAYRAGLFTAAVCTGIPAAEPIIVEAWAPPGHPSHRKIQAFVAEALARPQADASDRGTAHYLEQVHFAKFHRGDPVPGTPGRHSVVHGAHPNVGTKANALRVLIFLDRLHDAFEFVAAPRGKVVHLPSCGVGRRVSWDTRRVFRSLAEAERAGLGRASCCPDRVAEAAGGSSAPPAGVPRAARG